jgi:formate dehydrogenase subunit gamma
MAEATTHADPIAAICERHGNEPSALIEILHDLQGLRGCIREADLAPIARALNISRAEVWGTVSFYHDFRRQPAGRCHVKLCRAESCQALGAIALIEKTCANHGIELGGTSADGVTIEAVYCLGDCALSPAALVNDRLVGRLDETRLEKAIEEASS